MGLGNDTSACQADVGGGGYGLHTVNRLNTPLWHAWNPWAAPRQRESFLMRTSRTSSTFKHAQWLALYYLSSSGQE